MQEKVYKTKVCDVGELRQCIIQAWDEFDHVVIDAAISQWRARRSAGVEAEGGYFERTL
jgi:menaquinone-dependent protoporphyrinogen IX oxidase